MMKKRPDDQRVALASLGLFTPNGAFGETTQRRKVGVLNIGGIGHSATGDLKQ